jgi:cell fate regulator YaaT (PSP1 superfamily)
MNIILKFASNDKSYLYQPNELALKIGDQVLVDTGSVIELAIVISVVKDDDAAKNFEPGEGVILRKLNDKDKKKLDDLKKIAKDYLTICEGKLKNHGLSEQMKIVDADLSFDGRKLTIYFSAEGRIDFRNLVGDLIKTFKKIIRLQQIGARDQAKLFGGYGRCGQQLCCKRFLKNMESITLDMAKEQNILSLANKISGVCGKLMCCLSYEKDLYKDIKKNREKQK